MALRIVSDDLFSYLMGRVSGARFETFAKQIFAIHFNENFVPLGGIHDGGADGAISSYMQEVQGKPSAFVQFSITNEGGTKTKITGTIEALKKVGREPRQLIYATSQSLPKADLIVQEVYENQAVMVQIRDFERIKGYVNSNEKANHIFYESFTSDISTLARAADLNLTSVSEFAKDPTVYVYLNHELKDRFSRDHLNERVLDALIYWTLRDTDPDKGLLLPRAGIAKAIEEAFPPAKGVLLPKLNDRLAELSKKEGGGVGRLRHYRSDECFSLSF